MQVPQNFERVGFASYYELELVRKSTNPVTHKIDSLATRVVGPMPGCMLSFARCRTQQFRANGQKIAFERLVDRSRSLNGHDPLQGSKTRGQLEEVGED